MRKTILLLIALLLCAITVQAAEQAATAAAQPEAKPAAAATEAAPAPAKTAEVVRGQFTSAITEREPVDALAEIAQGSEMVYFFTELKNAGGTTVTHKWLHGGATIAEVELNIGGDRWRTRSSKKIHHLAPGTLEAQVVDAQGKVLMSKTLTIKAVEL